MTELDTPDSPPTRLKWLAYLVWVITLVLGFIEILVVHGMIIDLISAIPADEQALFKIRYQIGAVYNFSFVILGAIWLVYFVVSTYYYLDRAGQPKAWRVLAWTVGVQLFILLLAALL